MAYEAKTRHPDKQIHVTNEIIHNPEVNERLREMDIKVMDYTGKGQKDFSNVDPKDVVIFPAFGASVEEMRYMNDRKISLVDTTCPWVAKVWNAVDNQSRRNFTSVIHGKWAHEETVATASFAGDYIIVKDLDETQYVCDYILKGGSKEEFMGKFKNAVSQGFDPDVQLDRVGLANQTTMLQTDTMKIGKMLEKSMLQKYGPEDLKNRFMVVDTICDATQERQDAIIELVDGIQTTEEMKQADFKIPDMILVVGGFNSSNTSHLQEIPELRNIPSFWMDSAERIDEKNNSVTHKTSWGELKETNDWIPSGPINIGVTSGASTPDKAIEDILEKVFKIRNPEFGGVSRKAVKNAKDEMAAHEEVGENIM